MSEFALGYEKIDPTTWVYLSSLLMIGLFFKFSRFWSVRNLDLILLILISPGLLMVHYGREESGRAARVLSAAAARTEAKAAAETDSPLRDTLSPDVGFDTRSEFPDGAVPSDDTADASSNRSSEAASGGGPDDAPVGSVPASGTNETPPAGEAPLGVGSGADDPLLPELGGDDGRAEQTGEAVSLSTWEKRRAIGRVKEHTGFLWLLGVGVLFLVRMLLDPMMVRRPLLEPNLSAGGLTFIACSLSVFLMANVIISMPTADDLHGPQSAQQLVHGRPSSEENVQPHGPGYALIFLLPSIPTVSMQEGEEPPDPLTPGVLRNWTLTEPPRTFEAELVALLHGGVRLRHRDGSVAVYPQEHLSEADQQYVLRIRAYATVAKAMAILSHMAVVIGLVLIGYRHFDNIKVGIGAATLYLMLPYTAQMTGRVDHALPAALLIWAVLCYRRPLTSGMFLGLAMGVTYYPLFLLPLWLSFYWQRGLMRFTIGVVSMLAVMAGSLAFTSSGVESFWLQIQQMFGVMWPRMDDLEGLWAPGGWDSIWRLPLLAIFVVISGTFALWPAQKNLGTLLSCSAAVMVATQFWHGFGGGLYVAWYLPLFLLTVFRPNLEDRVALTVLGEGWFPRRRWAQAAASKAKTASPPADAA